MSYCIFAASMPEMFGQEPAENNPLVEQLLCDPEHDKGICHDFLAEAVSRFEEDPTTKEMLVSAVEELSENLSRLSMNDSFKPYVLALRNCVRYPPLVEALTKSPRFLPDDIAPERIELDTLLGPFFALSPLHPDVATNYFMGARAQGESYVTNNQNALRMTLRAHQDELFDIANCIIKSAKEPRERFLDWLALTVNKNHKRRATHVEPGTVSTDGFMVNVTVLLDRLCEPFMDATFSKVDRIDVDYLRRSPRVIIEDETKINADQKTADDFYEPPAPGVNNFISEIFFLTVASHHYGSEAANEKVTTLQREVKHFENQLQKMEAERPKYASVSHDPSYAPRLLLMETCRIQPFSLGLNNN
jgi:ubiquitin conjugation factor E4 B